MHYAKNKTHKKTAMFVDIYVMQELRSWNHPTWRNEQGMVMNWSSDNRRENMPNKARNTF